MLICTFKKLSDSVIKGYIPNTEKSGSETMPFKILISVSKLFFRNKQRTKNTQFIEEKNKIENQHMKIYLTLVKGCKGKK